MNDIAVFIFKNLKQINNLSRKNLRKNDSERRKFEKSVSFSKYGFKVEDLYFLTRMLKFNVLTSQI
jgi:hypothetical protein